MERLKLMYGAFYARQTSDLSAWEIRTRQFNSFVACFENESVARKFASSLSTLNDKCQFEDQTKQVFRP